MDSMPLFIFSRQLHHLRARECKGAFCKCPHTADPTASSKFLNAGEFLGEATVTLTVSLDFGSHLPLLDRPLLAELAEPYQGCSIPSVGAPSVAGKVVLIGRGGCTFTSKVGSKGSFASCTCL